MNEKMFTVTFTQNDLNTLQQALVILRELRETEAEDANMLLAWICQTKMAVE